MLNSWLVVLPPIIVLFIAFTSRRIFIALLSGIFFAGLLANNFAIIPTFKMLFSTLIKTSEINNLTSWKALSSCSNLFIFLFFIILGLLINLISISGGANAYRHFIGKKLHNAKEAESASLTLSFFLFLDDYFSSITVGSVMIPLTDKFKIARVKLAFLVNAIAASLCIITPISSWGAAIILNLSKSGISTINKHNLLQADTFFIFLKTIFFSFYPIVMILTAWFIVKKRISFGLMHKHEKIAQETGNLFGGKKPKIQKIRRMKKENINNHSLFYFIFPTLSLVILTIISLLYFGDNYLLGGKNNFTETLKHTNAIHAIFLAGLITLFITILIFKLRKKIKLKELTGLLWNSIELMGPSIIVLLLAWSLINILNTELNTGQYLANLLIGNVKIQFLPFMFFITSTIIAVGIGSAWGAMAIMIPLAISMITTFLKIEVPVNAQEITIIFPTLGAILSGAVSSSHISPTSDTMLMSAISTGSYHMDHVRTMHTYAFPILFACAISFLISGFLINYPALINAAISIFTALLITFSFLKIRNYLRIKKEEY